MMSFLVFIFFVLIALIGYYTIIYFKWYLPHIQEQNSNTPSVQNINNNNGNIDNVNFFAINSPNANKKHIFVDDLNIASEVAEENDAIDDPIVMEEGEGANNETSIVDEIKSSTISEEAENEYDKLELLADVSEEILAKVNSSLGAGAEDYLGDDEFESPIIEEEVAEEKEDNKYDNLNIGAFMDVDMNSVMDDEDSEKKFINDIENLKIKNMDMPELKKGSPPSTSGFEFDASNFNMN